ncbi:hypothetical protein [Novosphingobium sp. UBA1939]|uniref:hypothetical protein n=1 Tax=Novosphingobium sp. UBA1939 TaxID=1946982 RepID=UPI0025D41B53|nr:hypothetical protein [Novosphingobium sp. UBA1939]
MGRLLDVWPPKDWRAFVALVGSILGAAVLTLFVWWGCAALLPSGHWSTTSEAERVITIRWVLWIAVGAIAVVLVGLGMAINRRSFRGRIGAAEVGFDGGEDSPPPSTEGRNNA